ncbi:50S ribosomal protein L13 [Sporanaerobium hydrogeniformans]|uniref:50S ribosomal protein L13 n=1 Tax=Sporanaerobium hydrogeniformans TaxID=3072179 RepID=A0AC61DDZ6_9FIRM|nr:50S ribosomal protein L13 [Sporanaerobium hydrogeniformans]PHV71298.1 50S ribosomal protein L13 [Sporanaerobium hydrogeniformans]
MRTTYMANAQNVEREWFVVDATGQTVGRLASQVATVLRGKNKPTYTPHVDCGDHVIIINAEKAVFTGKKLDQKVYRRHSGYAGGLKETSARDMLDTHPERILMHAVKGMLPKNSLGRQMLTKLRVYAGADHKHEAQQPKELKF